jgi:hypothetical protein
MQNDAESRPPARRITHIRRDGSLERSLLWAALTGGAIGMIGVIGFVLLAASGAPPAPPGAWPAAIVATVTPSPIAPTPTPSLAPTDMPTPETLYVGGYAQVYGTEGESLRLRSDPGLQTTTLKTIPEGARLMILDGPRDADGLTWWRLRDLIDGAEGWAAQLYLAPAGGP